MKSTYDEVVALVIATVADYMGVPTSEVNAASTSVWPAWVKPTLEQVELIMTYEDEFDIEISDTDARMCKSPGAHPLRCHLPTGVHRERVDDGSPSVGLPILGRSAQGFSDVHG